MVHAGLLTVFGTALTEKLLKQCCAVCRHDAALQYRMVVKSWLRKQVDNRACCTGFRVGSAKHHTFEPGVQHGTAAHGTGLQRDVKLAVIEPVVASSLRGGPQRNHFGMGSRVV